MSRVQVLDVGDRVLHEGQEGVVLNAKGGRYRVSLGHGYRGGLERESLERIDGDLQPGDFVRVTGEGQRLASDDVVTFDEAEGIVVDETEYGFVLVWVWGSAREYQVRPQSLTRITRAEALA